MLRVTVEVPTNLALLKYMGKVDGSQNQALNPSLSLTLQDLRTRTEIEFSEIDSFECVFGALESRPKYESFSFSQAAQERLQGFMQLAFSWMPFDEHPALKRGRYVIRSWNQFPASAGIASSASGFAAMTLALYVLAFWLKNKELPVMDEAERLLCARLARRGSGSAARSFMGPAVYWNGEDDIQSLDMIGMESWGHRCAQVSLAVKRVSSSEAHKRVMSSPLWQGRVARTQMRLQKMRSALRHGDTPVLCRETWSEMWEMHSLFHTAAEPFFFMEPGSLQLLRLLEAWSDKLLVTLDAGPNVHILGPESQLENLEAEAHGLGLTKGPWLRSSLGDGLSWHVSSFGG